jgi:FkbM family methyltransferase
MLTRQNYITSKIETEPELLYLLNQNGRLTIFDVGACEAEDSIRYSNLFPHSTVYAFEPRKDNCIMASELIKKYNKTNIILENVALSDKTGFAEFFLSEGEPPHLRNDEHWDYGNKSSSLLPPSQEMKEHISWLTFHDKISVPTRRLDDYTIEKNIEAIDLMHLDVQGAELLVLKGAGVFIDKIKIIWMEVEAVGLYKNQPLKTDVEQFMIQNNFVNILDTVNLISGDQLYVNKLLFSKSQISKLYTLKNRKSTAGKLKSFFRSLRWR